VLARHPDITFISQLTFLKIQKEALQA